MPGNLTAAWLCQNTMTAGFPIAINLYKESPTYQSSRLQAEKLQGKITMPLTLLLYNTGFFQKEVEAKCR